MPKNDSIALSIVAFGITLGVWMSVFLPAEKLTLALPLPTALIGAGLAKWQG